MKYKVNEMFYSLKGEGVWTGTPMSFIRLAGCNLNCSFCDTLDECNEELDEQSIVNTILDWPTRHAVITGGEPLMQSLAPLVQELSALGLQAHLETNGTQPLDTFRFSWIAVSPKTYTLNVTLLTLASEIKFLVGIDDWEGIISSFMKHYRYMCSKAKLYVMPLAKSIKEGNRSASDIIDQNVQLAIDYCLKHPEFSLCYQLHKVLGVK